jgi:glycosyltransferase involved in cell wall biosynthesis
LSAVPGPRLALLGAFPWSSAQGSQVFAREQARALARLGARPVVVTYGRGPLPPPDDLPWLPIARRLSPRSARSGPSAAKLVADGALLAHWVRLARHRRIDAVIAHNAEAAAVALAARPFTGVPVVYVAHTLMAHELSTYGSASRRARAATRVLDGAGRVLDRTLARRADGVVVLTEMARRELSADARGPVALLPPGHVPQPPPSRDASGRACARAGVEPGRFALYTGNLDAYQGIDRLAAAAGRLRAGGVPVVVATHEPPPPGAPVGGLRVIELDGVGDMRALVHAAGVLVLPRRAPGGFPMKLLNYLESGRPVVAHGAGAPGLRDGQEALILPDSASSDDWAAAVLGLLDDRDRAAGIGARGRRHLEHVHDWSKIASATLEFLGALPGRGPGARAGGRR